MEKGCAFDSILSSSFQAEGAGLLHSDQQLLVQHGVGGVGREIQAVETRVSPEGTRTGNQTSGHTRPAREDATPSPTHVHLPFVFT